MQKRLQRDSMDDELRNRLWSALKLSVLDRWKGPAGYGYLDPDSHDVDLLFRLVWLNHFKHPIDTLPHDYNRNTLPFVIIFFAATGGKFTI